MEEKNKSPIYELAEIDYIGGMKYKEIADKYNVSINTVKSWKTRYKWVKGAKKSMHTKEKKVCTQKESTHTKKIVKDDVEKDIVEEVMENEELNEKQKLFCIYYSKTFNQTKSYQKAYNCGYMTAAVEAHKLLKKPKIKALVDELTEVTISKEVLKKGLLQQYIDIAFADITEYIEFGEKQEVVYDKDGNPKIDEDGNIKTQSYSYVKLGESKKVDGRLITEVSEGREGIKIKLADKMKAMDFLKQHTNMLSDEEKTKLDIEYKRIQNEKLKAEVAKVTGNDEPQIESDGFIEALNGKTAEVWNNETEN